MNVTNINLTTETITGIQTVVETTFTSYFEPFIWLFLGICIVVLGEVVRNYLFHIAGGVYFIGLSLFIFTGTTINFPFLLFFVLLGIGLIWHAITELANLKDKNMRRTIRDD